MPDSQHTDPARAGLPDIDPERDAKIDELLLAGLEHYFGGRFQEAINVWSRVLFLDRGHERARAYIERARGALAERQRRSEELAHEGVAALERGDEGAARQLLASAASQGEHPDVALAYLERLERLQGRPDPGTAGAARRRRSRRVPNPLTGRQLFPGARRPVRALPLIGLGLVAGAIVLYAASRDLLKPLVDSPWSLTPPGAAATVAPEALPVPRSGDLLLARARGLYGAGHLQDALGVLDRIAAADPVAADADRLRAEIQRALLAAAGVPVAPLRQGPGE